MLPHAHPSRGLRGCGSKQNGDFSAAGGAILGGDCAVFALSEGVNDGQSESGPAGGARSVGAAETIEGARQKAVSESWTVVGDTDLDIVGVNAVDADGDRRSAVLGGVVG